MSRPLSTVEVLEAILQPSGGHLVANMGSREMRALGPLVVEAEPRWFPHNEDGSEGEAQAVIMVNAHRYAVCLEPLP